MEYRVECCYTEAMVRAAVRHFMLRRVLLKSPVLLLASGLLGAALVSLRINGRTALTGALGAFAVAGFGLIGFIWRAHFVNTVGKFREMSPPVAEMVLREDDVTLRSGLGEAKMPWTAIVEVWKYPEFWMLFLAFNSFMTVPVDAMSEEARSFFAERLATFVAEEKIG